MNSIFVGFMLGGAAAQSLAEMPPKALVSESAARLTSAAFTPPPPMPPGPPNAPNFLIGRDPILTSTGDPRVDAFRERILVEAGSGWRPFLLRLFHGVRADPQIIASHQRMNVPRTPREWVRRYVTPKQIASGRRLFGQLQRSPPPSPGGTPLEVQIALWGMYSNYGAYRPSYDPVQTYLVLGAYGLGPDWTYHEFYKLADLIISGQIRRPVAKTYEDGRLGQVQLFPDEWPIIARDGDADGKVDLWNNRADIFASIGPRNWAVGTPLIVEVVRRPVDVSGSAEQRTLRGIMSGNVGVSMFSRPSGGAWPLQSRSWSGRYVEPFGPSGPAYILTRNFSPVNYRNPSKPRYWNESEDPGFGIAVALLADAIAGRAASSVPIP